MLVELPQTDQALLIQICWSPHASPLAAHLKTNPRKARAFSVAASQTPPNWAKELPDIAQLEDGLTDGLQIVEPTLFALRKVGQRKNRKEGRKAGRQEGRKEGRQEGRKAGRQEGRKAGRQEGRKAGRQEGRKEGRKEGSKEGMKEDKNKQNAKGEARSENDDAATPIPTPPLPPNPPTPTKSNLKPQP